MVVQYNEKKDHVDNALLSAQEISFAKVLAGNEKKKRDQGLKKLVKWLKYRSDGNLEFTEDDFKTIWTGLYYSMWMSDKPLVQEELAENLSHLIHCFVSNEKAALLFIKCFYLTMAQSWAGLDQFRMDKFCMLARRFLRQSLEYCAAKNWQSRLVKQLMRLFSKTVLDEDSALGLKLHFIEVILEELAKVGREDLKPSVLSKILAPFVKLIATTNDTRVRIHLDNFFHHLIRQTDVAIEYEEKFQAWRSAGFPGGNINVVVRDDSDSEDDEANHTNQSAEALKEKVNNEDALDEDEKEEEEMRNSEMKPLDPRAGSVHVELPQIPVAPASIIKVLQRYEGIPESTLKGRRTIKVLIRRFRTLRRGKCPLGIKTVPKAEKFGSKRYINKCAMKLIKESLVTKQVKRRNRDKIKRTALNVSDDTLSEGDTTEKKPKSKGLKRKKQHQLAPEDQSRKRKIREDVEDLGEAEGAKKKHSPNRNKLHDSENVSAVNSPEKQSETSPNNSAQINGKENCSPVSPKKRKVGSQDGNVSNAAKKKKPSGNWFVDETEVNQPAAPANIITLEKKNPSAELLQEGETEIFIPSKRASRTPVFWQKAVAKANVTPVQATQSSSTPAATKVLNESVSGRRISFNLAMNRAQEKQEYLDEVRKSPQIPFDSTKRPKHSALKPGLSPTPINPFYRSKKLLF